MKSLKSFKIFNSLNGKKKKLNPIDPN